MEKRLSFHALSDLVLSGKCAVLDCGDKPKKDFLIVLVHMDLPGAVALFGIVQGSAQLAGCFSGLLRIAQLLRSEDEFAASEVSPFMAVEGILAECMRIVFEDTDTTRLRFLSAVDGVDLLEQLKRVHREVSASSGVLH